MRVTYLTPSPPVHPPFSRPPKRLIPPHLPRAYGDRNGLHLHLLKAPYLSAESKLLPSSLPSPSHNVGTYPPSPIPSTYPPSSNHPRALPSKGSTLCTRALTLPEVDFSIVELASREKWPPAICTAPPSCREESGGEQEEGRGEGKVEEGRGWVEQSGGESERGRARWEVKREKGRG